MRCLKLSNGIDRALDAVADAVSPCGKHCVVAYGGIAAATGIEYFDITAGTLVSVLAVAETALYRIVDAWTDDKYKYLYVLDVLTPNPATTVRLRLFSLSTPSATALATVSYTNAAAIVDGATGFLYSPNARGGDVSCDSKYAVFSYITTIGAGGPPTTSSSVTTVLVVDAITLATVASFTFTGRTNKVKFCKVSCGSKKACTYIVFGSSSDVGSTSPAVQYAAPCQLNIYRLSVKNSTATLIRAKKLPQYCLDVAVAQPLKRNVPGKLYVGCRNTIKSTTAPTNLVTVTNNLVLSTSLCDTAELREYLLTPKKCKLVAARKIQEDVVSLAVDDTGDYVYAVELYGTNGDGELVEYAQTDNWKLVELTHLPVPPLSTVAVANKGKYALVAGADNDATVMSLQLIRCNCDKKQC